MRYLTKNLFAGNSDAPAATDADEFAATDPDVFPTNKDVSDFDSVTPSEYDTERYATIGTALKKICITPILFFHGDTFTRTFTSTRAT